MIDLFWGFGGIGGFCRKKCRLWGKGREGKVEDGFEWINRGFLGWCVGKVAYRLKQKTPLDHSFNYPQSLKQSENVYFRNVDVFFAMSIVRANKQGIGFA